MPTEKSHAVWSPLCLLEANLVNQYMLKHQIKPYRALNARLQGLQQHKSTWLHYDTFMPYVEHPHSKPSVMPFDGYVASSKFIKFSFENLSMLYPKFLYNSSDISH